jgi:hypothetical protein
MSHLFENVRDPSTTCPGCGETECLRFDEIPPSRLEYEKNGENYTIHNPAGRDYTCTNCEVGFVLFPT